MNWHFATSARCCGPARRPRSASFASPPSRSTEISPARRAMAAQVGCAVRAARIYRSRASDGETGGAHLHRHRQTHSLRPRRPPCPRLRASGDRAGRKAPCARARISRRRASNGRADGVRAGGAHLLRKVNPPPRARRHPCPRQPWSARRRQRHLPHRPQATEKVSRTRIANPNPNPKP